MAIDINREIAFTLKEYTHTYNTLLKQYLMNHEDFDEKQFVEIEIDFYNLCYDNSNLTKSHYEDRYVYSINGGNCEILIPKIYDSLITFKEQDDGWDLELALKYKATFTKILKFLKDNKKLLSNINTKRYNTLLNSAETSEVKELLIQIFYKKMSIFNVINYINEKTTNETHDIFINEFNFCYGFISCEFMFHVNEDDIKEAIEKFENSLEFIYVDEEELSRINSFIRVINNQKTVFNVTGLSSEKKENSEKIIYLNNLMIDYQNGFFANEIEGFENISHLRSVYNYINKKNNLSNTIEKPKLSLEEINPYPKIFKNYTAYTIFKKLQEEFGNTNENLSNYSFVFHKMTYEDLIHFDLKQQSYFSFLDDFDISLSRIKPLANIGKIAFRESIYFKTK